MKIQYVNPSPKAGIIEHLPPQAASVLISAGFAVHIPYKDFRERLAAEGTSGAGVNVNVVGTEWGFLPPENPQFRTAVIVKKVGAETTWYSAPPAGCPLSIIRQFEEATQQPADPEVLRVAQCEENNRREAQHAAERIGLARILAGK